MKKVLFVGDINVDIIRGGLVSLPVVDKEVTCDSFEVAAGSSAFICAAAYSALGGSAGFCGLAGRDDYGSFMLGKMGEFGIDTSLVGGTDSVATGVTVNLIHGSTRTQVTYPGTISAFDGAGLDADGLRGFTHVHFAGPYQQLAFREKITTVLDLAASLGITASLDPQWDITEKWLWMDEWLPRLSYFFANDGEACSITGAGSAAAAWKILSGKTACPVVKAGRAGVCVEGGVMPTYAAEVVDTTGAGDSFDAGFLYGIIEMGMQPRDAADFGNAVGARSCMFRGGTAARSSREDIMRIIREARYERV